MAVYTMTLKTFIESGYTIDLTQYPIFDENARAHLNESIIRHYWWREIGLETPAMFSWFLAQNMNEIMPYYNELYKTTLYKYDPTQSISVQEIYKGLTDTVNTNKGTTSSKGTTKQTDNSNGKNLYSDTPQGLLSSDALQNQQYLTNATLTDAKIKTPPKARGRYN